MDVLPINVSPRKGEAIDSSQAALPESEAIKDINKLKAAFEKFMGASNDSGYNLGFVAFNNGHTDVVIKDYAREEEGQLNIRSNPRKEALSIPVSSKNMHEITELVDKLADEKIEKVKEIFERYDVKTPSLQEAVSKEESIKIGLKKVSDEMLGKLDHGLKSISDRELGFDTKKIIEI